VTADARSCSFRDMHCGGNTAPGRHYPSCGLHRRHGNFQVAAARRFARHHFPHAIVRYLCAQSFPSSAVRRFHAGAHPSAYGRYGVCPRRRYARYFPAHLRFDTRRFRAVSRRGVPFSAYRSRVRPCSAYFRYSSASVASFVSYEVMTMTFVRSPRFAASFTYATLF